MICAIVFAAGRSTRMGAPKLLLPFGRSTVLGEVVRALSVPEVIVARSARNRFTGVVLRVVKDKVTAQVEIQAGPHRIVSLMTREAADELGLAPGVLAVASVKSTSVVVELPRAT